MLFGKLGNKRKLNNRLIILFALLVVSVVFGQIIDSIDFGKHRGEWWVWPVIISLGIPCLSFVLALTFMCVGIMRGKFRNNDVV